MKIKTKIRISLLAIIILCLVFVAFLIYPLFQEIKNDSSEILVQKQDLLLLESKTASLEEFKTSFPKLESDLNKTETLFIKTDLPVDFIRFLEKTSKDSNVATQISLSPGLYQTEVTGSFPDFLRFLEKLQTSQYLIEVGNLSVSRREKGDIRANLSLNVLSK